MSATIPDNETTLQSSMPRGTGGADQPFTCFDPSRRRDVRLLIRAVREGWPIPVERRPAIINALLAAVENPDTPTRVALTATEALVLMQQQNVDTDSAPGTQPTAENP